MKLFCNNFIYEHVFKSLNYTFEIQQSNSLYLTCLFFERF